MGCDLDEIFASLAARLPETDEACFRFSADSIVVPPRSVKTDRIVIKKRCQIYDSVFRSDLLEFHASKPTYCHLGLLATSVLFSPGALEVELLLEHSESDIRRIVVRRDDAVRENTAGYHSRPSSLIYYPNSTTKHPWTDMIVEPDMLPGFFLSNGAESVGAEDWEARDTIFGFGRDPGFAHLIELLLNASRSSAVVDEYELESEAGFRGVAPRSCEVRFWLPGSIGCIGWNASVSVG